jgi:hypothetical protein
MKTIKSGHWYSVTHSRRFRRLIEAADEGTLRRPSNRLKCGLTRLPHATPAASGRIYRDGTVRVRMTGNVCSFDVVGQKEHR